MELDNLKFKKKILDAQHKRLRKKFDKWLINLRLHFV